MYTYYTYISFNADLSLYYIGSSKCIGNPLEHKYYGSGKAIADGSFVPSGKFVMDIFETRLEAAEAETELLRLADVGNNPFFANKRISGGNHSDESHHKLSEAMQGANHPMFGKKHTEETKARQSEANKGKFAGANNPNYGQSATNRDITLYSFMHEDGRTQICTRSELCKIYGLNSGAISKLVRGYRKSRKGWRLMPA